MGKNYLVCGNNQEYSIDKLLCTSYSWIVSLDIKMLAIIVFLGGMLNCFPSNADENPYKPENIIDSRYLVEQNGVFYLLDNEFTGIETTRHKDGQPQSIAEFKDGKEFGFDVIFSQDGSIPHPPGILYNLNGRVYSSPMRWITDLKHTVKIGVKVVNINKILKDENDLFVIKTINEPFSGIVVEYDNNDNLIKAQRVIEGKKRGFCFVWNADGDISSITYHIEEDEFDNIMDWFHAINSRNGLVRFPRAYLTIATDGLMRNRISKIPFTGIAVQHFDNGRVSMEHSFERGLMHGLSILWDQQGNIIRKRHYNREIMEVEVVDSREDEDYVEYIRTTFGEEAARLFVGDDREAFLHHINRVRPPSENPPLPPFERPEKKR